MARFYASIFHKGPSYYLVATRANGQLAFGACLRAPTGAIRHGAGLLVLTLTGDRMSALTRFDNDVPGGLPKCRNSGKMSGSGGTDLGFVRSMSDADCQ